MECFAKGVWIHNEHLRAGIICADLDTGSYETGTEKLCIIDGKNNTILESPPPNPPRAI